MKILLIVIQYLKEKKILRMVHYSLQPGNNPVLWIRIGFDADPDPAFLVNADPDPDQGF